MEDGEDFARRPSRVQAEWTVEVAEIRQQFWEKNEELEERMAKCPCRYSPKGWCYKLMYVLAIFVLG